MNRSILVIADYFPPAAVVGVHRVAALCRHLAKNWRVTVVTPQIRPDDKIDLQLLDKIPANIRVNHSPNPDVQSWLMALLAFRGRSAKAGNDVALFSGNGRENCAQHGRAPVAARRLADWASWWLHVPDARITWLVPAVLAGMAEARIVRPTVIFASAPMWTSLLVGATLSWLLRVPFVADFRDPWCGSAWRSMPFGLHRAYDCGMESFVLRQADRITCAWDGIRRHLIARRPDLQYRVQTILNGFDPDEIEPLPPERLDNGRCVLLHAGTFYGHRSPLPLLESLKLLKQHDPAAAGRLSIAHVGGSSYDNTPLEILAQKHGVADKFKIIPPVPHRKALSFLKGCDVAILMGQSGGEQLASVPAKAYEYIGAGKAVLAIGAGTEAVEILRRGGCRVWHVRDSHPAELAETMLAVLQEYGNGNLQTRLSHQRAEFTQARMAEQLERVLVSAIRQRPCKPDGSNKQGALWQSNPSYS